MNTNIDQQSIPDRENSSFEASLALKASEAIETARSPNTTRAYLPRQVKFKQWCIEQHYPDNLVTEMKIVRFVRELFDRGKEKTITNDDNTVTVKRTNFSLETLKLNIKALLDLHNKQKVDFQGVKTLAHPRGDILKAYEASLTLLYAEMRKSIVVDPPIGPVQNGYNSEQLIEIADYYMKRRKTPGDALRDRVTFLMNHMMMLGGETLRDANFHHMFSLESKDEGYTRCPVFVMKITGIKTDQIGHKLYSGVIRHKNVQTCAFGAIGLYLFHRFHVKGEDFPDFSLNEKWFGIKLFKGRYRDKAVTYPTQANSIRDAFAELGINSKKKTYSGRPAKASEAEMAGNSIDHVKRVGGWNNNSMDSSYLNCLPIPSIRVMQGFTKEKGSFWLPRGLVTPPMSLQKQIFPLVEKCQETMQEGQGQTICAEGFLKLLVELRVIILQDAVLLQLVDPEHEVFQHKLFQSTEFLTFSEDLRRKMACTRPPAEVDTQRVVSDISHSLAEEDIRSILKSIEEKLSCSCDNSTTAPLIPNGRLKRGRDKEEEEKGLRKFRRHSQ